MKEIFRKTVEVGSTIQTILVAEKEDGLLTVIEKYVHNYENGAKKYLYNAGRAYASSDTDIDIMTALKHAYTVSEDVPKDFYFDYD